MRRILIAWALVVLGASATRAQQFAISTELSSLALTAPNVGIEMVTGNSSTLSLYGLMAKNPWWTGKPLSITVLQPEYRFYFSGRPISKFFVGIGGVGGLYDITWGGKRYDGYGLGGGITFGYVMNLNDRLNLDFHSGFGAIYYLRKEYFEQDNFDVSHSVNGMQRANASGYYLLPTRLGVSLIYIFR